MCVYRGQTCVCVSTEDRCVCVCVYRGVSEVAEGKPCEAEVSARSRNVCVCVVAVCAVFVCVCAGVKAAFALFYVKG